MHNETSLRELQFFCENTSGKKVGKYEPVTRRIADVNKRVLEGKITSRFDTLFPPSLFHIFVALLSGRAVFVRDFS